jgi:predicted AlkP superfamily pyrophosphatase or phosphodiesterase
MGWKQYDFDIHQREFSVSVEEEQRIAAMPKRIGVIDMPGLSRELLREIPADSSLGKWIAGQRVVGLTPSFPAVTSSVQATLTTGKNPSEHGIIGNGIATFRSADDQKLIDASNFAMNRREVSFWEQSNQLLDVRRFWQDESGKGRWKTALLFFQQSMPGFAGELRPAADIVLTPKPDHGPDGKLTSLCWSAPPDLVPRLFKELGPFPLMNYWGPMAGIASSQWIAKAAGIVWREHLPQLQWVYIPHLDYDLQRFGPKSPQAKAAVKDAARAVEPLVNEILGSGGKLLLLSEYAMREVNRSVQPNAILEEEGLLLTKQSADGSVVDFERSSAFVMVDHQVAHVYAKSADELHTLANLLKVDGVNSVGQPE